jgi:hypothetical protein
LKSTKILSWVPTGPETKDNYSGEDQHQFTELDWTGLAANMGLNFSVVVGHEAVEKATYYKTLH